MADRPEVRTAPAPITAIDLVGLAGAMGAACLRLPFRQPRRGPGDTLRNVTISATRELCRSFLGYSMSLPVDEFRGIERVLDRICGVVLPPRAELEHVHLTPTSVGGVPGIWFRLLVQTQLALDPA
jgi:hypothetical protein